MVELTRTDADRYARMRKVLASQVPLSLDATLQGQIVFILMDLLAEQREQGETLKLIADIMHEHFISRGGK